MFKSCYYRLSNVFAAVYNMQENAMSVKIIIFKLYWKICPVKKDLIYSFISFACDLCGLKCIGHCRQETFQFSLSLRC